MFIHPSWGEDAPELGSWFWITGMPSSIVIKRLSALIAPGKVLLPRNALSVAWSIASEPIVVHGSGLPVEAHWKAKEWQGR